MHPATLAEKGLLLAPNWEQLSEVVKEANQRPRFDSLRCMIALGPSWPMDTGRPYFESLSIDLRKLSILQF
jgi:hypothetical protein